MRFVAPILKAAIASLQAGLDDRIAVFNAEAGNPTLVVPDAGSYAFGGRDDWSVYPAVEVGAGHVQYGNLSLAQVDADVSLPVVVGVWLEGGTGEIEELYEQALGYGRVVTEVLIEPDAFGAGLVLDAERLDSIDWLFPTIPVGQPDEGRRFQKWKTAAIGTFQIDDYDVRP